MNRRALQLTIAAALAAAIVGALGAVARADGDPASDELLVRSVFLPYEPASASVATGLEQAVESVYEHENRLKVAVVATKQDLGSVSSLFDQPAQYAQFLGAELQLWYVGPLLVVMPSGFGYYDGGRSTSSAQQVLRSLNGSASSVDDLVQDASTAVQRLAAAGALASPDLKPPLVTLDPPVATRGKTASLRFELFDDSGRASAVVHVYELRNVLATFSVPARLSIGTRTVVVRWPVPRALRSRQLRLCVLAADPSGNRAQPACAAFLRVS